MSISTPALLFGSISLMLLAYTNRFVVVANLVRSLHSKLNNNEDRGIINSQIPVLKKRLTIIRNMQAFGVLSFIFCTISLFALFLEYENWGKIFFFVSVLSLLVSLIFGLWEIIISKKALNIILEDMEHEKKNQPN